MIELTIETLVNGGDGLARHGGKVVFVAGVLPGERVRCRIIQRKKDFDRAECVEVLEPSPDRIEPPCPAANTCGGCNWLHIKPEAQARFKVALARGLYTRLGGFDPADLGIELAIETGPTLGYRHRLQVHADARGRLGFKSRGSANVTVVDHCPVAHASLQPLFAEPSKVRAPARLHAFGHDTLGPSELRREDMPITKLNDRTDAEPVRVKVLGKIFAFPLDGFFQSNLTMLERLIPFALGGLQGRLAYDLYSGVGLFAAFLREHFEQVVAIEESPRSTAFIAENAGPGVRVYTGKLEELVTESGFMAGEAPTRPDAIVVDPPREGLHAEALRFLVRTAAPELVYVSCDVATQARDLKALLAAGYALQDLRLFDFYPQTHHLEAVARLRLK